MSGAQHTPGPWYEMDCDPEPNTIADEDKHPICDLAYREAAGEREANAQLIAAAPELAAALSYAADALQAASDHLSEACETGGDIHEDYAQQGITGAIQRAEDALRKAGLHA